MDCCKCPNCPECYPNCICPDAALAPGKPSTQTLNQCKAPDFQVSGFYKTRQVHTLYIYLKKDVMMSQKKTGTYHMSATPTASAPTRPSPPATPQLSISLHLFLLSLELSDTTIYEP